MTSLHLPDQLANWKAAGETYLYRGHSIFYHTEGRGEVLVCIHGFPTASWDGHAVWPRLVEKFRVVAVDMIGVGLSDKPLNYSYSLFDQANLHEGLLAFLGEQTVHLLAHDYGDTVVQELLARHLAGTSRLNVRSVCLLNGGLFPEAIHPHPIQKLLLNPLLGPMVGRLLSERRFQKSFSSVFGPDMQPT